MKLMANVRRKFLYCFQGGLALYDIENGEEFSRSALLTLKRLAIHIIHRKFFSKTLICHTNLNIPTAKHNSDAID